MCHLQASSSCWIWGNLAPSDSGDEAQSKIFPLLFFPPISPKLVSWIPSYSNWTKCLGGIPANNNHQNSRLWKQKDPRQRPNLCSPTLTPPFPMETVIQGRGDRIREERRRVVSAHMSSQQSMRDQSVCSFICFRIITDTRRKWI